MSDQAAVQRVGTWWANLDPTTKSMFEQIFAEQPELAVRVLSGGSVAASEDATSLDDLFGGVESLGEAISPQYVVDVPVVTPEYPEVGTAFTVTYTLTNLGTDAPADRNDAVRVMDIDQNVVAEERASGLALPKQGSESMEVNFASGLPADGRYAIEIWVNLDGGAWGAPANEHGSQAQTGTSLVVGAYEAAAGPAMASEAFQQEASMLANEAQNVQSSSYSPTELLEPLRQFTARAKAMVDAAVNDFPTWRAGPGFSERLANLSSNIQFISPEDLSTNSWPRAEAEEAGVNAYQAALPFSRLPYTQDLVDDYMPDVVTAVEALRRCYY